MERVRAGDVYDLARPGEPRVSPDGERVAFVRSTPRDEEEREATVYVVPVGGDEPRQFTVAEGVDSQPRWSPSGDRLAFVSTRGADDDRPQLWVLPTGGGEARQVTDVAGGVEAIQWSPDGSRIAFTQATRAREREDDLDVGLGDDGYEREEPDPRVIDRHVYRAGQRYFDEAYSGVYLVTLAEDAVERVAADDRDRTGLAWGDESTLFWGIRRGDDPDDTLEFDVERHDLASGTTATVASGVGYGAVLDATTSGVVVFPVVPLEGASMRQVDLVAHDTATGEETVLTEDFDRTVADYRFAVDAREEHVYFTAPDEGSVVLARVPIRGGDVAVVLDGPRHVAGFDVGEDVLAFAQSEWDHPGDVFAATPGGGEEVRLTRLNAGYLDGRAVREPEEVWFENPDGRSVQGWVLTPPDFDPAETYPLVVEIHGGPHVTWTTSGTMWHEFQTLAAAGYVVFWCNPRGSTGYGEDHATAIERNWGDVTMADVMAGAETVAAREYVDESNAFVTGGSFGGYMTAWIVGHTDFFAGACAQRGVYDLSSFYGSTDAYKLIEGDFGTTPWEEPAFLWEQSPVAYASDVTTPTLVMHADLDYRVPVNNGEMFYLFLRKNGVDTRLVRYPREGHELSRSGEPAHVVDRLRRIRRWFDGYGDHTDDPPALERDGDEGLAPEADDEDATDVEDTANVED